MKLVFMTYYAGMHEEVMELLGETGIENYTYWGEVQGRLSSGDPREGSQIWPGYNSALQAVLGEESAERLIEKIGAFNGERRGADRIDAHFIDLALSIRAASKSGEGE